MRKHDAVALILCAALFFVANFVLFAVDALPVRVGGLPDLPQTVVLLAGVVMTLAMFSFLYRDNPIFRAAENLFVGLGLGVLVAVSWDNAFRPHVYDILIAPLFDSSVEVQTSELIRLVPITMGVLIVFRISRKRGWFSRYPLALMVGFWAGFSIQPTIHTSILKQIAATIVPTGVPVFVTDAMGTTSLSAPGLRFWMTVLVVLALFAATVYLGPKGGRLARGLEIACGVLVVAYVLGRAYASIGEKADLMALYNGADRLIIMLGALAVLFYFFFSLEHTGTVGLISKAGVFFLMVAFGASFGYTVMARESLLIGRFQFLLGDWLGLL